VPCKHIPFSELSAFRARDYSGAWPDLPVSALLTEKGKKCANEGLLDRTRALFENRPIWTTRALVAVLRRSQPLVYKEAVITAGSSSAGQRSVVVSRSGFDEVCLQLLLFAPAGKTCHAYSLSLSLSFAFSPRV
jgi:RNA polymerase III transcription factor (TF)IIIC subunit HTH domain